MNKHLVLLATLILAVSLTATFACQIVSANPHLVSPINVNSPINNKVYPSNQVELNFTPIISHSNHNYTSFSYSLDGKEPRETSQSSILTDLPSGSHKLIIYGNSSAETYGSSYELLNIVYFSTTYSSALLNFLVTLIVSLSALSLLLFFGRKRIIRRLKGEKGVIFWWGLACFLFFTCVVFAPGIWSWTKTYLFPNFLTMAETDLFSLVISPPFMIAGFLMMWVGTRKSKNLESKL